MKESFSILYSDDAILAIDKPSGWLSIPDRWDLDAPVVLHALSKEQGTLFPVHRIDKDTSGVLVFARTAQAHRALNDQFSTRAVEKVYFAIAHGEPAEDRWEIRLALRADGDREHRTIVDAAKGKSAATVFEVVERFRGFAFIKAMPETGRTHQIRVHLAASNMTIVADPLYGDGAPLLLSEIKRKWKGDAYEERPLMARTALHAAQVALTHPARGEKIVIEAPLPRDFKATLAQLRKTRANKSDESSL